MAAVLAAVLGGGGGTTDGRREDGLRRRSARIRNGMCRRTPHLEEPTMRLPIRRGLSIGAMVVALGDLTATAANASATRATKQLSEVAALVWLRLWD